MFGLLIEYLALTGINTITQRVNAEPGWISSFEKGQDKASRKYYSDYCYSCVNTAKTSVLQIVAMHTIMNLAELKKSTLAGQFWQVSLS